MSGRRSAVEEHYNNAEREERTNPIVYVQQYRRVCHNVDLLNNCVRGLESLLKKTNEAHGVVTAGLEAKNKKSLDEIALLKDCLEDKDRLLQRTIEKHNIDITIEKHKNGELKLDKDKAVHNMHLMEDEVVRMKREQKAQSTGVEEKNEKMRALEIDKMALQTQLDQQINENKRMKNEYERKSSSWNGEKEDLLKEKNALLETLTEVEEENRVLIENNNYLAKDNSTLIMENNALMREKGALTNERQRLHEEKQEVMKHNVVLNVEKGRIEKELTKQKDIVALMMKENEKLQGVEKTVRDQEKIIKKLEMEKEQAGRNCRFVVDLHEEKMKIMADTIRSLQSELKGANGGGQPSDAEGDVTKSKKKTVEPAKTANTNTQGTKRSHDTNGIEKLSFKFIKTDTKINAVKSPFAISKKENKPERATSCIQEEFTEFEDDIHAGMGKPAGKR